VGGIGRREGGEKNGDASCGEGGQGGGPRKSVKLEMYGVGAGKGGKGGERRISVVGGKKEKRRRR